MNSCCASGVTGDGPTNTGVMIIGIAPGQQEVKLHKPFQGPSGQLLDAVLEAVGWSRDRTYCTNICCTFHNEPTPEQLAACAPRLHAEIRACATSAPNGRLLIIALGKIPSEYLFHMQFGKIQGAMLNFSDLYSVAGTQVVGLSSFHPSGILQSNDKPDQQNDFATSLVYDLEKIVPFVEGTSWQNGFAGRLEGHIKPGDFELINNPTRAQALLDEDIDATRSVVIDIETDYDKDAESADPYGNILCVGLRYTDRNNDLRSIAVITQAGLEGIEWPNGLRYVGHYLYGFDSIAMQVKFGAKIPTVGDTYVKSYVKDERTRRGLHKLKNRSRELCGAGYYENDRAHQAGMELYTYNANDVYYTDILDEELEKRFDDTDRRLYYDLLLPSANMYSDSQLKGANIDQFKLGQVSAEFIQQMHSLEAELIAEALADQFYGNHTGIFNLNSPMQVLAYLRKRGHKIESTGKDIIEFLTIPDPANPSQHIADPWVGKLLKYRRYVKAHAVYCVGTQRNIKFDHYVHPQVLIPGTRTGRPSIINPPVNTLPHTRSIGELSIVRAMYVPDDPDNDILMEFDYCLDADVKVLRADLTWQRIGDVVEGDELIGFDEDLSLGRQVKLRSSIVEGTKKVIKKRYKVITDQGEIIASEGHMWVANSPGRLKYRWIKTENLYKNCRIAKLCEPWKVDSSNEASYLQGFFDGEGWVNNQAAGFGQNDGETSEYVQNLLNAKGFTTTHSVSSSASMYNDRVPNVMRKFVFTGNRQSLRFLGEIRPPRLLKKARKLWDGVGVFSKRSQPATVLAVEELEDGEVISVQTSTRTLIADGFLSHNCQIELYILQWLSQDQHLLEDLHEIWPVIGKPDFHSRTCELIIGGVVCPTHGVNTVPSCAICRKWEFDRDAQKHVNFGIPYGESAMGLMRPPPIGTGQSLEVCQSYINAWYDRNTEVLKWQRRTQQELVDNGEVQTAFGRKFRTPLVCNAKQLRQIINAPVQSTASDYTLTAALELKDKLKRHDARMLWTTYDSILLNVPERNAQDVAELVVSVMQKPRTPGGPSVPVEYKAGKNLYEVSEVHA